MSSLDVAHQRLKFTHSVALLSDVAAMMGVRLSLFRTQFYIFMLNIYTNNHRSGKNNCLLEVIPNKYLKEII